MFLEFLYYAFKKTNSAKYDIVFIAFSFYLKIMRDIFLYFDAFSVYISACGNYYEGCVQNETQISSLFIRSYFNLWVNLSITSIYSTKRFRVIDRRYHLESGIRI